MMLPDWSSPYLASTSLTVIQALSMANVRRRQQQQQHPLQHLKKKSWRLHWQVNLLRSSGIYWDLIWDNTLHTLVHIVHGFYRKVYQSILSRRGTHQTTSYYRNSTSSKLAKSIITRLTNKQNLGGTRLVRGYQATTDRQLRGSKSSPSLSTLRKAAEEQDGESIHDDDAICIEAPAADDTIKVGDEDGEEPRQIDHLVFVIPG